MAIDPTALAEVALTENEYQRIVARLGREPNALELGIFGAMWSEHCGYKHSKPLLRQLPKRSAATRVLVEAGEENAGAVDIGEGLAVVFKVESHNHPSAIEPYQGAATGVGGIVRDIFTMGARPIALLNSLRFGPLDDPRNRYLFHGVVAGISGYGNCLGIPDVGGEIQFGRPYSGNPLVNAMCVGLVRQQDLIRARASGAGNTLLLVGADTGRDGIHGATFASADLDETAAERRPAVQVGNPFLEKLLLEACLEVLGNPAVVGMQDLGAAGLTSATVESAAKGGAGVEIDVALVPRREEGMTPYEVMLSESQERMLVIVRAGHEAEVIRVFERWGLHAAPVGKVTDTGRLVVREGEQIVADLPIAALVDPPQYRYDVRAPAYLASVHQLEVAALPARAPSADLLDLLGSPNIASRRPVYRQYDHQVQNNTVVLPGEGDAAVLRIKGTRRGIALSIDGNGRHCYLDPFAGGARAVAEAARNVVCAGARPLALTNCLNFGNPERPEIYFQLAQAIAGMAAACEALDLPVVSGNVSLYNESEQGAVYPTPIVGVVGLLDEIDQRLTAAFQREGDLVLLIGDLDPGLDSLAGSEWLELRHGLVRGRPTIDLARERAVQQTVLEAARAKLLASAHDCSDGGLAVALAESCILGNVGLAAPIALPSRPEGVLFGEAASRIVVSTRPEHADRVLALAAAQGVPATILGTVGGDSLTLGEIIHLPLTELRDRWENGLRRALSQG
ncbi:MAG: phosphoribosylformylglycinamidine synthase subunit PurL [Chloroflexota bacterium]|nr:phosphoribosylformylglycinamidine synthase subunit PurL [Dehalococcoidia bacterium]MDW8253989.1 phosphoribosylformylglycinamidine synthase subunit PurL [Chloroflexota bacterium]